MSSLNTRKAKSNSFTGIRYWVQTRDDSESTKYGSDTKY